MQSLWMLFATFVFSIMGLCVKLASSYYSTSEIVMYRSMIGVVFMVILITTRGGSFRTTLPWHHLWRGVVGVVAFWLWFHSIDALPLAMAMTLNYTSPIWIAAILFGLGWWQGKSRFEWKLVAAILLSFIGVAMLLQPSIRSDQWLAGTFALTSGMLSALAYLQVRKLGQMGEPEYRVVFYFCVTGSIMGLFATLFAPALSSTPEVIWHPHTFKGGLLLIAIGTTATAAQIAMTRAYRLGKTLVTANLQYTGIVFSSMWGIIVFGDILGRLGWVGISVIMASGIAATFYNTHNSAAPAVKKASVSDTPTDAIVTEL